MATITLSELEQTAPAISEAIKGHEVIAIVSRDSVIARLVIENEDQSTPRPFGLCKGQFTVPANFNDPLPDLEANGD